MKILAISGSLRKRSKNTTVVYAAARLAPAGAEVVVYEQLGELPLFNPDLDDLDSGTAPAPVLAFRAELRASDGVFICSPEYGHGVSGVMKNAIDWLFGSGEFIDKPTVLFNASPTSLYAHPALLETLTVIGGQVIEGALPRRLAEKDNSVDAILAQPELAGALERSLRELAAAITARPADEP